MGCRRDVLSAYEAAVERAHTPGLGGQEQRNWTSAPGGPCQFIQSFEAQLQRVTVPMGEFSWARPSEQSASPLSLSEASGLLVQVFHCTWRCSIAG